MIVTFHVVGKPTEWGAFVSGDDTRGWSGEPAVTVPVRGKKGKRDYRVSLPAKGVEYVTLRTPFLYVQGFKTTVKVTG